MLEKFTRETLSAMSKEELEDAVLTLQDKLDVAQKEIESLKADAEIGKKYKEHLLTEAKKLITLAEGDKSPLLSLVEKADVDTLKSLIDEYTPKVQEKLKSTAKPENPSEEKPLTKESLLKMSYKELLELSKKFIKGGK